MDPNNPSDSAWPVLCNVFKGYYTSLGSILCGLPSPSPNTESRPIAPASFPPAQIGEQQCFTSQSEMDVQTIQPRKRQVIWPCPFHGEGEEVSPSENGENENGESDNGESENEESEAERQGRGILEIQDLGEDPPSQSPQLSQESTSDFITSPPTSPISRTSTSDYICRPPSQTSSSSSHNSDTDEPAWQAAELDELTRICSEESDYERIAKAMNDSYWWQMQIPMVQKPREYGVENVREAVLDLVY
jgi:hypothetical protein